MDSKGRIAYITTETAVDPYLHTYSGGLAVLSAAMGFAAHQTNVPFVTVTLLPRHGYYDQTIEENPESHESSMGIRYVPRHYNDVLEDTGVVFPVAVADARVFLKVWRLPGEVFKSGEVLFLDADIPENDWLSKQNTAYLYPSLERGGNEERKIVQSILLGYGAVIALKQLGYAVDLYHLNEGYAGFTVLALAAHYTASGLSLSDALTLAKKKCIFTTHTPEFAGNPAFPYDNVVRLLSDERFNGVLWNATSEHDRRINLTVFCLDHTACANGVSVRHGKVASAMWTRDIKSVTNGSDVHFWQHRDFASANTPDELGRAKHVHKRGLLSFVAQETGHFLSENVLTFVWARRWSAYKRPKLLFADMEWIVRLLRSNQIQVIFSGKPHPDDFGMRDAWNDVLRLSHQLPNLVILPGYELELSKMLKRGTDVWLNNPRAPQEASGTSGQSAAMNGALNLSTVDGWMCEANPENYFPFGVGPMSDHREQDARDALALRETLEARILPLYSGDKNAWYTIALGAMREAEQNWSATRMLGDYVAQMYGPTLRGPAS